MKTEVRILRGSLRGRSGWISGNLEDRRSRGITKAIVHAGAAVELLKIENLEPDAQLEMFAPRRPSGWPDIRSAAVVRR